MPELTITAVAYKAGIRPSTLRYYEKIGLLPLAQRVAGGRRYDVCTLKQLELIAYAKQAGFSLAQIQALQESASRGSPSDLLWRNLAAGKADELDQIIFRAQEAKNRLAALSRCRCLHADFDGPVAKLFRKTSQSLRPLLDLPFERSPSI